MLPLDFCYIPYFEQSNVNLLSHDIINQRLHCAYCGVAFVSKSFFFFKYYKNRLFNPLCQFLF